ncbi:MAG TPA: ATP-binding protein [Thermoleophilaceae bacterium]|nr:ATP-binding protein [Thermoleophilaceae bacterium]
MGTTSGERSRRQELEIPAELDRLHETREWANRIAEEQGLSEDDCFQIKLAMSEAVTNAIIHGSSQQTDVVRIVACKGEEALVFEVTDPGRLDTGDPIERLDEGGRGLELVSMVMDEVKLVRREGGGSLRFSKRFAAA